MIRSLSLDDMPQVDALGRESFEEGGTQRAAAFYEALGYSRTEEPGATHRRTLPARAAMPDRSGVR